MTIHKTTNLIRETMPNMYEIYDHYSQQYDELVRYEDYHQNLSIFLNAIIKGKSVLELGAGTGRVTEMYIDLVDTAICCDRAAHMLEQANKNLSRYADKIRYECIDTRDIGKLNIKVDCIIEGWALGHTAIDEYMKLEAFVSELFKNLLSKLNEKGQLIFIETMGTNTDQPKAPDHRLEKFYALLEEKYGMKRYVIRTDYCFNKIEDAQRILSFFFGEQMTHAINNKYVKEFTGIWVWEKPSKN